MNFISKIFKQKKAIIFVLLFFITSATLLPGSQKVKAIGLPGICVTNNKCVLLTAGQALVITGNCLVDANCANVPKAAVSVDSIKQGFWWSMANVPSAIIIGIGRLILWASYKIAEYSSSILSYVISTVMNATITAGEDKTMGTDFSSAWASVRDLANMFIVLGFVFIGLATTLRIREWEAKKLLPRLIMAALLVNFSGLFCGLYIDASNMVTKGLGQGSSTIGETALSKILAISYDTVSENFYTTNGAMATAGLAIFFGFVYLALAFTFLYLSILLIARFAILAILYVLSPLAFAFWAFPGTRFKKYQTEWWEHFLKWSFVGVFGSFTLFLASPLLSSLNGKTDTTAAITTIIVFLIFIYVGFKMTCRENGLAAKAGGAIIGAAGFALGAGKKVGGFAAEKTGLSRVGNNIKSGATRLGEKMGLVAPGAADLSNQKELAKSKDRIGAMTDDQKAALANGRAVSHRGARDKAEAQRQLLNDGKMDKIKDSTAAFANVKSWSGDLSDAKKKDPRMAGLDLPKSASQEERNRKVIEATQRTTPRNAADWSPEVFKDPNVVAGLNQKTVAGIRERGSPALQKAMDDVISNPFSTKNTQTGKIDIPKDRQKPLLQQAMEGASKAGPQYKENLKSILVDELNKSTQPPSLQPPQQPPTPPPQPGPLPGSGSTIVMP